MTILKPSFNKLLQRTNKWIYLLQALLSEKALERHSGKFLQNNETRHEEKWALTNNFENLKLCTVYQ